MKSSSHTLPSHSAVYEELKPYGFYIHGGVDGGSNFVVYAHVALNKEAGSSMIGYRQAVAQYGRPLRLQADTCYEAASGIGADMETHRGQSSYLTGLNTANKVHILDTTLLRNPNDNLT